MRTSRSTSAAGSGGKRKRSRGALARNSRRESICNTKEMPAKTRCSKKGSNLNLKNTRRMSTMTRCSMTAMTRCSRKESSHNTTKEMPAIMNKKGAKGKTNKKGAKEMPAMRGAKVMTSMKGTNKEVLALSSYKRKESNCTTINMT